MGKYKIVGHEYLFDFGENAKYQLKFKSETELEVKVVADSYFKSGIVNHFTIEMTEVRDDLYLLTWTEPDSGNTVSHVDDFTAKVAYTNITNVPDNQFWRLKGTIKQLKD
ncbi:MAG: hypothetical protein LKJ22_06420 [Liquorilactobacillus nagelii]|jgi:phenolic acid decarboxylase|uniref:MoaF-related domain-containing protein n=1 Tax=Liquorilactobacillus nagelii TaxID=82688 RepID=UPI00242A391D|nr:hypothetical protein [Liquorilactobacillus nagelii]MCI1633667.1 hypothetical protein [Liquorilactobacillus nagelii]MCI1921549.1 hypothetical protein [Liquorilactobacillus nagelii]MCI1977039.1 hypothetical protein [Liquorilactobacillus nagelii]